ncbi:MAG: CoA pyrophosphatase [Dehalococcoidia bacterium]|nr:CoA pyrophosphatase [Dehalococcoidia bacterium]MSQ35015.1 CoA pyrophosphatase [Dehalococcoidia bacterium]
MTRAVSTTVTLASVEKAMRGRTRPSGVPETTMPRIAAVYALFADYGDGATVTLIRRSEDVSQHRGEYAFPGGGVEPDDVNLHATALREVIEELGVNASDVEPWGELNPEMTVTSGYLIVPFTGRLASRAKFNPERREVAEVVHVPLAALVDPAGGRTISRLVPAIGTAEQDMARDGRRAALELKTYGAYAYNGRIIWGATARILAQMVSIMKAA